MSAHETVFRRSMSIVGSALAVLGMFSLYENAVGAVGRLSHLLAQGSQALGAFPAFILAVSQAMHIYGIYHHRVLQGLFQQLLVSSWPLLLVICGTVLCTDSFPDKSKAGSRK